MTEDDIMWKSVSSPDEDFNDFPLAFANVDDETGNLTFNIDGEDIELESEEGQPLIQGTYQGIKDISSEDNPDPSIKVLVESESDERTYAINKVTALENQLEHVEEGQVIGLDYDGLVEPEDGYPWQNWDVQVPER